MPYSTLDEIVKLLPEATLIELTDDTGAGTVDGAVVAEAIAQADAEIDSYCGGRYGVPLSPVPEIAKKLSADIALYHLYSRRVAQMPEARKDRYKDAVRLLEGIAKGAVTLGADTPASSGQPGTAETNRPDDENTFTRDSMLGF